MLQRQGQGAAAGVAEVAAAAGTGMAWAWQALPKNESSNQGEDIMAAVKMDGLTLPAGDRSGDLVKRNPGTVTAAGSSRQGRQAASGSRHETKT